MHSTLQNINLTFGVLNVNSFNVSTLGSRNSKSYCKIEGLTQGKHDVIFVCNCRLKDKSNEISRMMGLNRNASYKFYFNSSKESRGVAIAIKRNIVHEIIDQFATMDENLLLLKIKIKGHIFTIGAVYGPNENNQLFFRTIRHKLEEWDTPYIIGGDFNTILDGDVSELNLDRVGPGRVPNPSNSLEINNWITAGDCLEPFRALYPDQREVSYIPFGTVRRNNNILGKTRLDFFLIHENLAYLVQKVKYEDRIGYDFDHKMVTLVFGKRAKKTIEKVYNSTLDHWLAEKVGFFCNL
jgi:exonuclease III